MTRPTDELVKRLIDSTEWFHCDCEIKMECAARIEELSAQLEISQAQAEQAKTLYRETLQRAVTAEADFVDLAQKSTRLITQLEAECDALKAELAEADAALLEVDALDPEGRIDGCSQAALRGLVLRMGEIARDARQARDATR